ncbi:kinase-like protein [Gymnopus androsaceus JB14]|uniref:Kinase-like protein n=1 Tax=Gymnopus androsaceus JB14 TaxID=1447944 RepID=A0A6A4IFZ4_9AGAR|nr:kinase-like protein [Gymnopus androsaceus JB14]
MNFDVPHYIPQFLWKFWLSSGGHAPTFRSRVHIYDVDSSNLSEATSIPELAFRRSRSILQDIGFACSPNSRAAYDKAESAFMSLESQAEEALQKLIDKLYPSTTLDNQRVYSQADSTHLRIPISPHDLSAIIKFFVFLRFRNGPQYRQIVQELMEPMDLEVSTKGKTILSVYSPLIRQVRLQTVLRAFRKFFETPTWEMKPSSIAGNIVVRRRSCLGVAAEEDREFILPECCFGVLDESFGGGSGIAKAPESESFDCFFPILPTLALYLLRSEDGCDFFNVLPTFIEVGLELELDIHLRNAMVLSSVPPIRRSREVFIHHLDLNTPKAEVNQITWTTTETTADIPNDILEQLAIQIDTAYGSDEPSTIGDDSIHEFSEIFGPKLFFSSLSSIVRSISSYDAFHYRWMPDQYINYSRLKQRCRQKFGLEGMKKMWTLRRNIVLSDLTGEVEVIGEHAVAFGAFSDVWTGKWFDTVERKTRVVAIKYLRQVMVQGLREKLLKRLHAELLTWHQLCHRNLATLYGIMQTSTSIGMVSAWCDNGTISSYLKRKPRADRLKLVIQVASGVAYLHHFEPPVVHGDLKGGNILVDAHEQAVITDFGLSKVMEDLSNLSNDEGEDTKGRSSSSSFCGGSTRWLAPELVLALVEDQDAEEGMEAGKETAGAGTQRTSPRVTTASDVYAFASVCLEIVTGKLPHANRKNDYSVVVDILHGVSPSRGSDLADSVRRMFNLDPAVPIAHSFDIGLNSNCVRSVEKDEGTFRNVLDKCWNKLPCSRPSMEEVLVSLSGIGTSEA